MQILNQYVSAVFVNLRGGPISLAGRINTVKIYILPKFVFLFQTIPILIQKSFFTAIDGTQLELNFLNTVRCFQNGD